MTDHPDHDPLPEYDGELDDRYEAEPDPELPASGPGALAPIWARGVARVIDLFIVGVGGMFVARLAGFIETEDSTVTISNRIGYALAILGVWALYEVMGTLGGGRTVGKYALGLRIRRVDEDRAPAPHKAMTRWLVMGVAMMLPLGGLEAIVLLVVRAR
jgi:uncharacterized RDD family membrane protein YckC